MKSEIGNRQSPIVSLPLHRFAHDAMGTTFEVAILGKEAEYARQASHAAFEELDRLEAELSRFIPFSDVSQINDLTAGQSVRVGIATLDCLELAARIHAESNGAFDVTIGSLMRCWRDVDGSPRTPPPDELAAARARTGMGLLDLQKAEHAVGVKATGVTVDLGAIGKGYAVGRIAELLQEWSIDVALIHSGQSTALALGAPPGRKGWSLAIRDPEDQTVALGSVCLRDRALSGSGLLVHGRHILDPRTGQPAEGKLGTWAAAPSAAVSDALSTAFMVMSVDEVERYCREHPDVGGMVAIDGPGKPAVIRFGMWE